MSRPPGWIMPESTKAKLRDHGGRPRTKWRRFEKGYILVYVGKGFPGARPNGWISEHRLVAAKKIGRPLLRAEVVHHIDKDPENNHPDNLKVMSQADHLKSHQCESCGRPY